MPVGHYVNAHYDCSPATCQTLLHWFQFTVLPLARLYRFSISLQPLHLSDSIASVSFDSRATCQIVLHGCQFTAVSLARLDLIGCFLQSCHLSDFIAVVSVYSRATGQILLQWIRFTAYHWSDLISLVSGGSPDACQTLFHGFSLRTDACQTLFHWFQLAVLPLARFDLSRFSLQPAYICTETYNSESYHVWLCPLGPWPNAHYTAALPSARIYFTRPKV